ncbi:Molybdate transporter 1 [Raphanus sativus]|uniref:Molybdate transporter 1-like n=1 Tax=Raphanus sativus TaxID=3726 RepID=A0A6J0JNJ1_RAPSA|nr:molybdate transporter 1-like [Raphanus sativus]KAJ4890602.1 Molybdate transporter 1 [Raphanus sativus]
MESQSQTSQPETPTRSPLTGIFHRLKTNLVFRSKLAEVNGAMGDLGTYIPIVLALTLAKDLDLGTTLIFTGIYNAVTGAVYGVPMPVQPMKSIAAVAISSTAEKFGIPEIMAAGICTGGILFVLGVSGLMQFVFNVVPLSVARGIQLSQGLAFAMSAVKYIKKEQNFSMSKSVGDRPWLGLDGLVLALVCVLFIILVNGDGEQEEDEEEEERNGSRRRRRVSIIRKVISNVPSALLIFLLGVVLAFIRKPSIVHGIKFGPEKIKLVRMDKKAWKNGFLKGTVPQLPLSVLNSVVAVCKLSYDLFPEKKFSAASVSMTVGLMNMVGCWFGAMPTCHGAGGLAGQYKFGGRSGGCVALLGVAKLVLGLVLGSSLVGILEKFPVGVLGALLLFAGIELAMAARDMNTKGDAFVMLVCTAVSLGSNAAIGFVAGIVLYVVLWMRNYGRVKPTDLPLQVDQHP